MAALNFVRDVEVLQLTDDISEFARLLVKKKVMPAPDVGDALHVAIATLSGIDYMLSWNVRHLANINKVAHLTKVCHEQGWVAPKM